jgi:hypothetical protein
MKIAVHSIFQYVRRVSLQRLSHRQVYPLLSLQANPQDTLLFRPADPQEALRARRIFPVGSRLASLLGSLLFRLLFGLRIFRQDNLLEYRLQHRLHNHLPIRLVYLQVNHLAARR